MKRDIVYATDFARVLVEVEETLRRFEVVFPRFYQELSIAYPWYMRWKPEWRVWKNGKVLKQTWAEIARYKRAIEEATAEGFETLDLDPSILRDLFIWSSEGLAQEIMYELNRIDKKTNPYR